MPAWFNERPFSIVTPELRAWWKRYSPEPMQEQFASIAGKPWNNWGIEYGQQFGKMEPGKLWWPTGASRFGVYTGIADKETVDFWRADVEGETDTVTRVSGQFNMTDRNNEMIQKEMYLLPPRPLPFYLTAKPSYIITLVDYRYWWWFRNTPDLSDNPVADWHELFELFRTTLGYDATEWHFTTPNAKYQYPGDLLAMASHIPIAILMDAAAWSIGCRVVVDFDIPETATLGKVYIMPLADSITNRNAAFPGKEVLSGGYYDMRSASTPLKDASCILPYKTTVSFERVDPDTGEVIGRTPYTFKTSDISGFEGYSLFGETVIYDTAQTTSSASTDSRLNDLAQLIVEDYLGHEAEANINVTLAGIRYLYPSGLFDAIEFCEYVDDQTEYEPIPDGAGEELRIERDQLMSYTKVTRHPYLWRTFTLHHYVSPSAYGSGASGGGGGSGSGSGNVVICGDGSSHPFIIHRNANGTYTVYGY